METRIGPEDIGNMLRAAIRTIREHHDELSKLDSVIGDGDHGAAMLRSMEAVENVLADHPDASVQDMLSKIGWAVMSAAGGSTGPLLGSFFVGMGEGAGGGATFDVACMIQRGVAKLQKQSKANVGDKTMMDALLPAKEALQAEDAALPEERLRKAAEAAARGAEATKDMKARFGRARNLGERSLGHVDPGARSMALILEAFSEGVEG